MANQTDKLPPQSMEAEQALLGSMLINPEYMPTIAAYLQVKDFFYVANANVWEAMLAIHERGEEIDNLTVVQELRNRKKLDQVGSGLIAGPAYITQLVNETPTHIHSETYAKIIERAAIRRRGLNACGDIAQMFLDEDMELSGLVDKAHSVLGEATHMRQNGDFTPSSEFLAQVMQEIEERYHNGGQPPGISTGLIALDDALAGKGWGKGELILIAARPGLGKTALALNTGVTAAKNGLHVAHVSMEMPGNELEYRKLSSESGINAEKLKSGNIEPHEWEQYMAAVSVLDGLSIKVEATGRTTARQLVSIVHRLHREWGIDILFVDYIQLMFSEEGSKKAENRNLEVGAISRSLKQIAMEFNIPVVALSQLNRAVEKRADKRPTLADLRDSGSLEQDADTVIFIYRDDFYNEFSEIPGQAELIIAKQRHGKPGSPRVRWIGNVTKFVDLHTERVNLQDYNI